MFLIFIFRKLLREQQERKSKIQGFIDRMKNPESNGKEREESKSDQRSVYSGTSSKGRDVSAGKHYSIDLFMFLA
jgi:prenyltransferase beta subunit